MERRRAMGAMAPGADPLTAWPPHFRTDRFTLLTIAIAALGGALVLGREFTYGVTLGTDSASFVAAARSLLAGGSLLDFAGRPYVDWPPLYPLLLAAAGLGDVSIPSPLPVPSTRSSLD